MKINIDISNINLTKVVSQIDYALSRTINNLAFDIRNGQTKEMRSKMGKPLPLSNSSVFYVDKSNKKHLSAKVQLNDGSKNRNGIDYEQKIGHLFRGGKRGHKDGEGRLFHGGYLRVGEMYTYGAEAPLTKSGYITKGAMNKIFSLAFVKGRNIGVTNTKRRGKVVGNKARNLNKRGYFVAGKNKTNRTKHLKEGIYRRDKGDLLPILIFVKDGHYKKMFHFEQLAKKIVGRRLNREFNLNLGNALKNAK